jgi:NADH dehydrogenase FAD-containing subunit
VIVVRATSVDASARRIALEDRAAIAYDTASFDIGSQVAGLEVPGARALALATRPIGRFVAEIDATIARARTALDADGISHWLAVTGRRVMSGRSASRSGASWVTASCV